MRFENKVALVTGAASGFGKEIAISLANEGAKVALVDINFRTAEIIASELGENALAISGNVSNDKDVKSIIDITIKKWGSLEILVNNAGTTHKNKPMTEVSEDEFDKIFGVNVKSIFLTTKYAVPFMKKQRNGVILNIASTAGIRPRPGLVWYNTSKGAVITATKAMAIELAPFKIRVNAINPVAGETGMLHLFMGEDTPKKRSEFISSIPWGRLSLPKDIANASLFLCSDDADMVTGVCMEVDGGRCI